MKAFWDRASGGMYFASSVSIGINPRAKPSFLMPNIARGAVSAIFMPSTILFPATFRVAVLRVPPDE